MDSPYHPLTLGVAITNCILLFSFMKESWAELPKRQLTLPRQDQLCRQSYVKGHILPTWSLNAHLGSVTESSQVSLHQCTGIEAHSQVKQHIHLPCSLHSLVFCAFRSFANWVTSSSFAFASFKCSSYRVQSSSTLVRSWVWMVGYGS